MTRSQLDTVVAVATGESLDVVRSLGFTLVASGPGRLKLAAPVEVVLDCPTCGQPVAHPGRARDGSLALAECVPCDLYFDYVPEAVYTAPEFQASKPRGI